MKILTKLLLPTSKPSLRNSSRIARTAHSAGIKIFGPPFRGILLLLVCCLSLQGFAQTTTLQGVTIGNSNIGASLTDSTLAVSNPIYAFQLIQAGSSANLNQVSFVTSGTYSSSTDITAFTLYVNTLANSLNGSTPVSTGSVTAAGAGTQTINLSSPYALSVGVNYYFFIVPTINSAAVSGRTISVSSLSSGNIAVSAGSVSGSVAATGIITIVNPAITGSTGGSRCGTGTVVLGATATAGANIGWFTSPTGGSSAGTGTSYTTPSISTPTTYYAQASETATFQTGTLSDNTTALANYNMNQRTDLHYFSSANACTINSVDVYPSQAGTLIITMCDASGYGIINGTPIATSTPVTITSGMISNTVPVTIPLGFSVPAGAVNYQLGGTLSGTAWIYRGASNSTYGPYSGTINGFSLTGDAGGNSTATGTSGAYSGYGARCYFYNWNITMNAAQTPRTSVTATVNPMPDAGAITGTPTVCPLATTTLSDVAPGGVWTSTAPGVATVGSSTGIVTGVSAGTTTISYTVTNGCGTVAATQVVTVNPLPNAGTLSGVAIMCETGAVTITTNGTSGGAWSTSNPAIGSINSIATLTGVSFGNITVSYTVTNSCGVNTATHPVNILPLPGAGPITGTTTVCAAATTTLGNSVSGGTWSSSAPAIATVGSSSGIVTGVSAGTATITYTVTNSCGSATTNTVVTVNPLPDPGAIIGGGVVCPAGTETLANAATGGVWTSGTPSIATVGSSSGTVTGVAAGTATISYTATNGCGAASATLVVTVNPLPDAGIITGTATVCPAATTTLSSSANGGVWSSVVPTRATVGSLSGDVTGVAVGTATISYTVTNSCGTAAATTVVTVNPLPNAGTITGIASVCPSAITTLSDAAAGGAWTSENPSIATVGGSSGVVTGVAEGTVTISYTVSNSCGTAAATTVVTVNPLPDAGTISGTADVCPAATTNLANSAAGGVWTSLSPSIATIGSSSGTVTGVAAGTATVSYTVVNGCGTAATTIVVTVNPLPNSGTISGTASLCPTAAVILSASAGGGTWTSLTPSIATIGSSSGFVTGIAAGTTTISYTVTNGCGTVATTRVMTVNPMPDAGLITGPSAVCPGATIALGNVAGGGSWSSVTPGIAAVGSASGIVTGVSAGATTISYTVNNSCGTAVTTMDVTVNPLPNAGTISGLTAVCPTATVTLSNGVTVGTWMSETPAAATIDGSGLVTGVAAGTTVISYSVTNICGTAVAMQTVTVNPLPVMPGAITGSLGVCQGASVSLSNATAGGVWSSGFPAIATINTGGVVNGIVAGTATMSYTITNGCGSAYITADVTVNPLPAAGTITGTTTVCAGSTIALSDAAPGGTWSSTSPAIASVGGTGIVTGLVAGTATIQYTVTNGCGTAIAATIVTINPLPNAGVITGASFVCAGSLITLADMVSGGTWTSSLPAIATVSTSGDVAGITPGTTVISYAVSNMCGTATATASVVVSPLPDAGIITGPSSVCASGSTITLTNPMPGGVWSSGSSTASVSGGVVTGISAGAGVISYTVSNGCGVAVATKIVTVMPLPYAGAISGSSVVCVGANITLASSVTGGVWTSSNATASVSGGVVTGVSAGVDTIIYTFTNSCGVAAATHMVTIGVANAGVITGPTSVCVYDSIVLTDTTPGGYWTRRNTSATVSPSGTVIGLTPGVDTIFYIVPSTCGIMAIASAVVTVNAVPAASTITGFSRVCAGAHVLLSNATPGGTWYSSSSGAPINASGNVSALLPGSYIIRYVVTNSCGTDTAKRPFIVDAVSPLITGDTTVCEDSLILLTVAASSGGTWTSGNSFIASVSNGVVRGVTAGTTNVTYVGSNTCGTTTSSRLVIVEKCITGVQPNPGADNYSLDVFPNPTSGEFTIRGSLGSVNENELQVEVTNMVGQVVFRQQLTATNGNVDARLKLSNTLANGMYLLNLRSSAQNKVIHLVVER